MASLRLASTIRMELLDFRVAVMIYLMVAKTLAEQGGGLLNTTSEVTTDMSEIITEEDRVTFPPGDVLNDPRFKKWNVVFPHNETILEGIRNGFPYYNWQNVINYTDYRGMNIVYVWWRLHTTGEIALDPVLQAKLYCRFRMRGVEWSFVCLQGNDSYFMELWKRSPLGLLSHNIPLSVFNAALAFLSFLFGILGNLLIIISILAKKELRTATNLILASIAAIDCANSVMVVVYGYTDTFLNIVTDPVSGCRVAKIVKELTQLVAINHLVTLSFDRYFAICWSMRAGLKFTKKKIIPIVIINWIIGVCQVIPYVVFIVLKEGLYFDEFLCRDGHGDPVSFVVYTLSVYLLLPVPILCFNCTCIVRTLLTSIRRSREMTGDTSRQTNAEKARLRLTYMLITLVVIYVISVTPGRVVVVLRALRPGAISSNLFKTVDGLTELLRAMNSCTNVIVYTVVSRQFRAAFGEILCRCCRRTSAQDSGPGNRMAVTIDSSNCQ